jgi:hypothetical protein
MYRNRLDCRINASTRNRGGSGSVDRNASDHFNQYAPPYLHHVRRRGASVDGDVPLVQPVIPITNSFDINVFPITQRIATNTLLIYYFVYTRLKNRTNVCISHSTPAHIQYILVYIHDNSIPPLVKAQHGAPTSGTQWLRRYKEFFGCACCGLNTIHKFQCFFRACLWKTSNRDMKVASLAGRGKGSSATRCAPSTTGCCKMGTPLSCILLSAMLPPPPRPAIFFAMGEKKTTPCISHSVSRCWRRYGTRNLGRRSTRYTWTCGPLAYSGTLQHAASAR